MKPGEPPALEEVAIRAAPPLAVVGALFAALDLVVNRVAVRAMAGSFEPTVVLGWMRFGALPRNVAGVCALLALLGSLFRYLRMPGFASLWIRLPVAAFSGFLLPTLVLATTMPREQLPVTFPLFVLVAMCATYFLVAFFAIAALGYRGAWLRLGLVAALLTALQSFVVVAIATVRTVMQGPIGGPIAWLARHGGELTWLLVPALLAPAIARRPRDPRERLALVVGVAVFLVVLAVGALGEATLHPHYSVVVYGAFRVAALPESASIVYALPIAVGLGAAAWGLASADPWRRQVGAGLVFWIAGGYAPRSPIQLLDSVVATILFARAAQAADPEGVRRALMGWTGEPELPRPSAEREPDASDEAPEPEPTPTPEVPEPTPEPEAPDSERVSSPPLPPPRP